MKMGLSRGNNLGRRSCLQCIVTNECVSPFRYLISDRVENVTHSSIASVRFMFIGCNIISFRSQESVVGTATSYGLDNPRFESWQEQIILSKNCHPASYSMAAKVLSPA